jgi:hypothetical protein
MLMRPPGRSSNWFAAKGKATIERRRQSVLVCVGKPPNHYEGEWGNDGKGLKNRYLGFRFVIKKKAHYGWARVSVSEWPFAATLTGSPTRPSRKTQLSRAGPKGRMWSCNTLRLASWH